MGWHDTRYSHQDPGTILGKGSSQGTHKDQYMVKVVTPTYSNLGVNSVAVS